GSGRWENHTGGSPPPNPSGGGAAGRIQSRRCPGRPGYSSGWHDIPPEPGGIRSPLGWDRAYFSPHFNYTSLPYFVCHYIIETPAKSPNPGILPCKAPAEADARPFRPYGRKASSLRRAVVLDQAHQGVGAVGNQGEGAG